LGGQSVGMGREGNSRDWSGEAGNGREVKYRGRGKGEVRWGSHKRYR